MNNKLENYQQDGADSSARAVLALIQGNLYIKDSVHSLYHPRVARWENSREQGYVISVFGGSEHKDLHIAFFTHRNSEELCAVKWNQRLINSPNIDTAEFGSIYKDKWDLSHKLSYNQHLEMAEWIAKEIESFVDLVHSENETSH